MAASFFGSGVMMMMTAATAMHAISHSVEYFQPEECRRLRVSATLRPL